MQSGYYPEMETLVEKQKMPVGYGDKVLRHKQEFVRLLAVRIEDIVWREHLNRNMIHLYRMGEGWLAFDKSAYFVWQSMQREPMGIKLPFVPYSAIMIDIQDKELPMLYRKFIIKDDTADYKSFFTPFSLGLYEDWRRKNL